MFNLKKSMKSMDYKPPQDDAALEEKLGVNLLDNIIKVRELCSGTSDLLVRQMEVCGIPVALLMCEGMFSLANTTELIIEPLTHLKLEKAKPEDLLSWMRHKTILSGDTSECYTYGELFRFIMSGFVVILLDGKNVGMALGLQGFQSRSISEPSSETNVRGSREGFVESLRVNMSMVRRRMKTPKLKLELSTVGEKSKTDICLVYRTDMVSSELLKEVKYKLSKVKLDVVLESGYVQPYLERKPLSIFSEVGVTERPDTICAKVSEGRIGILFDGTPFALVIPFLFTENFQSFDDYANRPYYATFIRWLKYVSFFLTILLPGFYVSIATFHPELFPNALLFNGAASEESTPFPIMMEALIIHFFYEVMREAGLRLPRPVGHAVSIVGALVIGDAAVTAGLIGAPMVMVVALTAISSFVVAPLYEPVTILRFTFILLGGLLGMFGITLGLAVVMVNLCAINTMGIPITSPASPFDLYSMRDVLFRWGWKSLGKEDLRVQDLPGSQIKGGNNDD